MEKEISDTKQSSGKKPNWFKRHLNWTLLIMVFMGIVLYSAADMVAWYVPLRVSALVVMLAAQVWYLTRKGRSLGWLFLNLLGGVAYAGGSQAGFESSMFLAGLLMLCLKNKRAEKIGQLAEWDRRNKEIWEKEHGVGETGKE